MSQYVRSSHHATRHLPNDVEMKKKPRLMHKNVRASRIGQKRNALTDEVSLIVYGQLYRQQLLNRVAHENHLPVRKMRKSDLFAAVKKRLKIEQEKLSYEFKELLQDKHRFT